MDDTMRRALGNVEQQVARVAASPLYSRQPRFGVNVETAFSEILRWTDSEDYAIPEYSVASRRRDAVLSKAWRWESLLAGVMYQADAIIKNRGWTMTGGRNQVRRYTAMAHNADDGAGWRKYISKQAQAFYATDIGALTENGREGAGGPLREIYHLDSTRCAFTGDRKAPLAYYPKRGKKQVWTPDDFFSVTSMPCGDEDYNGLGYCAVSRCIDMAKLMIAVMRHDAEQLGSVAPRGLLILQNISDGQWRQAMATHSADLAGDERLYYGGVAVFATMGDATPDAKLVALSQMPQSFDQRTFVDMLMYAYALAFGYDPSEFWPVQFGSIGRGTETAIQHTKATAKGGLDFAASHQEQFQRELPDTVEFLYEQRDIQGMLEEAALAQAWANVAKTLYEAGASSLTGEGPLLTRQQALTLLVDARIIPEEWSEFEEDVQATDEEQVRTWRDVARDSLRTRAAATLFPSEPIVRIHWPSLRERVLFDSGADLLQRRVFATATIRRQVRVERATLYDSKALTITDEDVDAAIKAARKRVPKLAGLLTAPSVEE